MLSNYSYDNYLQHQIDRYNGDVEDAQMPTEDEWLDYYEESGIMKDYYAERQAERDEMLLWE